MKKIIVALSFFISLHIYAFPEGLDAQYIQKSKSLMSKSQEANKIMYDLISVEEHHPLNEDQKKQFVNAVCDGVRFNLEFVKFLATDINQARIIFKDDQLNEKTLLEGVKENIEYKIAQQFIGTKNECKS